MKLITREALGARIRDVLAAAKEGKKPALSGFALRSSAAVRFVRGEVTEKERERVRTVLGDDAAASRILRFDIGGEGRMGDGLSLKMSGARLERYARNPVVLHGHWRGPVGHSIVEVDGQRARATVAMLSRELSEQFDYGFSYALGELAHRRGHAASMGFGVLRAIPAPAEDLQKDPWALDVEEWELYEWSLVKVPMDPDAVSEARAAGIDTDPLVAGFARMLDELQVQGLDRERIERAWKAAKGEPVPTTPTGAPPPAKVDPAAIRAAIERGWQLG